ncbi:hypothetical protein BLOT_005239 [Blomia tropicalis]|nr:hypothetical protein BLOT_005239 [Blomia tropicalis]
MNPSGSEFTLRVAICDLVERLKRNQHKCTYLEDCRNQLVKEVIRLRLQNEWLAKQISDQPGGIGSTGINTTNSPSSASLPQPLQQHNHVNHHHSSHQQCPCNQQSLVNSPIHSHHCHLNVANGFGDPIAPEFGTPNRDVDLLCLNHQTNTNSTNNRSNNGSIKDESLHLMNILNQFEQEDNDMKQDSIKNLTIQMLKDLEIEMKSGRLKSDLIKFVQGSEKQTDDNDDDVDNEERDIVQEPKDDLMMMKFDEIDNENGNKLSPSCSAQYEAFNNNSDYYSNSHNLNIPLEDLYAQSNNNIVSNTSGGNSNTKNLKRNESFLRKKRLDDSTLLKDLKHRQSAKNCLESNQQQENDHHQTGAKTSIHPENRIGSSLLITALSLLEFYVRSTNRLTDGWWQVTLIHRLASSMNTKMNFSNSLRLLPMFSMGNNIVRRGWNSL